MVMVMDVWVRMCVLVSSQESCFLTRLHIQMFAFMVNEPVYRVLFAFWTSTTASCQSLTWRRVNSQSEQVGWFGKVGDEAAMKNEVDKDEDVHEKHQ
jgi:hypothetical protein